MLEFGDFLLFGNHVGDQRLFALRNGIDLQTLNVLFFLLDHFVHPLGVSANYPNAGG